MFILLIIYIISIIGTILSIRYDDYTFDENTWVLFAIFCPIVNTVISFVELVGLLPGIDKKLYKLITYET